MEGRAIDRAMDQVLYTCGTSLQGLLLDRCGRADPPEVTTLFERVYCRQNLTCGDLVEVPYYSCELFPAVCVHCACEHDQSEEGHYPICNACKEDGKLPILKRKRKLFTGTVAQ